MRQRVDAVEQHEVVARQELAEAPEVRLAIGKVEVPQDGDLVHRSPTGGIGGHRVDARRVRVRSGDLDSHAGLRQGRAVHRPGDRGHGVAAIDQGAGQDRERANVAGRADRRERDPHQIAAMRRGAIRGPYRGGDDPADLEQALHAPALPAIRLEQLEHPGVVGPGLAGQRPGHDARQVVVADADGVRVAERDADDLGRGPGTDARQRP